MSFNRIYLASVLKIFLNVYRHRVKLLTCGLLVMISLLCYILKNHDVNTNFSAYSKDSKHDLILNENMAHVIRHHRVLNKKLDETLTQINGNNNNNNNLNLNNIDINSFNKKKRNNVLSPGTVEKSHVDIVDFYKKNELNKNELNKNALINHIKIHNINNNLNQAPENDLIKQDESHLIKMPIFKQEKNQNNYQFMGNNMNMHNNLNRVNNNFIQTEELTVEQSLKDLERIIHIDLKGAPPKIDFFSTFIPMLKEYGATGILLEYEDTFPFEGELAEARHGHAYSLDDIKTIKKLAKDNNLYIIPLVQTYGHLEWILKLKKFAHLRDNSDYPQVITQCLNESYTILFDMLDQVIKQHPDAPYFHIGCDEVYYKLMHPNCSSSMFKNDFTEAFMSHLIKIASHVRKRIKNTKVIFWDDMLHNMDEFNLRKFKPAILALELEPMIWAYAENIKDWFQPELYVKYGRIFENVWAASAYKGASGELTAVTSVQHHYLNHLSWIEIILEKHKMSILKFRGIAITGWSRYDHFLALCDLLPQSIPSLIYNLQAMQFGRITPDKKNEISNRLGCSSQIPWTLEEIYDGYITCNFTGHEIYETVLPINTLIKNLQINLEFSDKYMTPLSLDYNYMHRARAAEVLERLNMDYYALNKFRKKFIQVSQSVYWNDTITEWLAVYLIPHLDPLYMKIKRIKKLFDQTEWKPRPLPVTLKNYPDFI